MKLRMPTILIAATAIAGCIPVASAVAQDGEFGVKGVVEISGGISFASITPVSNGNTGDATTFLSLGPEIGVFVANGFELGFSPGLSLLPGVSVITPSSGNGTTILQLFVFPAYNFHSNGSPVNPYLEVPVGYTSMSSGNFTDSGISWGIKGGIKVVAADHLLLTIYGQYLALTFTPENVSERSGMNVISFGVAVGGFF